MSKLEDYEVVRDFLGEACRSVKSATVRGEIRRELLGHMEDVMQELSDDGIEPEQAAKQAVSQMGDPHVLGKQFRAVHKASIDWGWLVGIVLFLGMGLVALYSVQQSGVPVEGLVERQAVYMGLGCIIAVILCLVNYWHLLGWTWPLYMGTVAAFLWVLFVGDKINGAAGWILLGSFSFNTTQAAPYFFLIAAAGFRMRWTSGKRDLFSSALFLILIPATLFALAPSFSSLILYFTALVILFWFTRRNTMEFVSFTGVIGGGGFLLLLTNASSYRWERITAWIAPNSDPFSIGYMQQQSLKAIESAGWWGQGFGVALDTLPYAFSDNIIPYTIHSLGWGIGALIVLGCLMLFLRAVKMISQVRDPYGRALSIGVVAILGTHMLWNLLMSVGLLPFMGVSMPFISYGGSRLWMELAAVGLFLGIFRQKNRLNRSRLPIDSF